MSAPPGPTRGRPEDRLRGDRVGNVRRTPPGRCATTLPMKGRERRDSSPLRLKRLWGGCGAAGPRPVLMCFYRFDETDAPRSRFPHALRLAALPRALPDHPSPPLLTTTRGGHDARVHRRHRPAVQRRAASRRTPSIDVLKDPRGIHPPGFIARPQPADIEKRGSDALPTDGMGGVWHGAGPRLGNDAASAEQGSGIKGLGSIPCMAGGLLLAQSRRHPGEGRDPAARESAKLSRTRLSKPSCMNRSPSAPLGPGLRRDDDREGRR